MPSGILEEMTRSDFSEFIPEVVVIPVGATEQHGPHLPFGTDTLSVDRLVKAAVRAANEEGARALMLPTVPYGIDTNMMELPYTVTLTPRTLMTVLSELIESMAHHGLRKFLLVNGHGGNCSTLETLCREFAGQDLFVGAIDWWRAIPDVIEEVIETQTEHACEFETSAALALLGDMARMDLAKVSPTNKSCLEAFERYGGKFSRPWHLFTVNGATHHPEKATREKGERLVQAAVERLKEVIVELCRVEYDESFPYPPKA